MNRFLLFIFGFMVSTTLLAQNEQPLYRSSIPGATPGADMEKSETGADERVRISKISRPTIRIYLPEKSRQTGAAVVIFPGGGYGINAIKHEGWDVAQYLSEQGIAAFVVKYRLPDANIMNSRETGPLQDAQEAIKFVRKKAKTFGIDPSKVGVLGFSAGGHLAAITSTHFQFHKKPATVRPDFTILVYPVISMATGTAHSGSRENLLGKTPTQEMIDLFSADRQVTAKTPPAFLVHAKDDRVVIENSYLYREALKKNGVPVETLIFEKGGHGYGMYNKDSPVFWPAKAVEWLQLLFN